MSQSEKAAYYRALKQSGVTFDRHYREYSTAELKQAYEKLRSADGNDEPPAPEQGYNGDPATEPQFDAAATAAALSKMSDGEPQGMSPLENAQRQAAAQRPAAMPPKGPQPPEVPVLERDENELPGQRLNQSTEMQPIRKDEQGRIWYQEEVRKPSYPKPRGRRVLRYMDTGVKTETAHDGRYVETFEVAGNRAPQATEAKITLPSYQVGIYKDPRFPFKIHVYNGRQAFDLFEVQNYYGGAELVPLEIKRVYVENVLCYDIRTTVRAIQTEYRQLQLQGKV